MPSEVVTTAGLLPVAGRNNRRAKGGEREEGRGENNGKMGGDKRSFEVRAPRCKKATGDVEFTGKLPVVRGPVQL